MLINNDPYQRETLSKRPIRQPLNESRLTGLTVFQNLQELRTHTTNLKVPADNATAILSLEFGKATFPLIRSIKH